jgi:hypothetical protein
MPGRPGTAEARTQRQAREHAEREIADSPEAARIADYFRELAGEVDFGPTQ